jgi:hypothetical protein
MLKLFYFHILFVAKLAKLPHLWMIATSASIANFLKETLLLACITKKAPKHVEKLFVLPKHVTAYACTCNPKPKAHNNCTCKPKLAMCGLTKHKMQQLLIF